MNSKLLPFTVDVEDGINIAMRDQFNIIRNPTERINDNTEIILGLLDRFNVKATFFILGEVAKHYPGLVKNIHTHGHELGVHGYSHRQYFLLNQSEVKQEISYTKALLEDITGHEVLGHRAPAFSIMPGNAWALALIQEAGFKYDSSIVPVKMKRYGWSGFEKEIVLLELPNKKTLFEVPISVCNFLKKSIPVGGGGYLKFFPFWFTNYCFAKILQQRPAMVYIHPYELDCKKYPDYFHDAAAKVSFAKRMKIKTFPINKKTVLPKLEHLLMKYQFTSLKHIVEEQNIFSIKRIKIEY